MPIGYVQLCDGSNAVLFVAGDESRHVTGVHLMVDGGALPASTTSGAPA
jgi:hypothetical protein